MILILIRAAVIIYNLIIKIIKIIRIIKLLKIKKKYTKNIIY